MRKALFLLSLVVIVVSLSMAPIGASARGRGHGRGHFHGHGHHHFHGYHAPHVGFWFGSPLWWGPSVVYPPYPYAYGPWPYYRERVVIVEEPPVYVERPAPSEPSGWWYYCESERSYYPDVERCPEPWIKVAPRSQ